MSNNQNNQVQTTTLTTEEKLDKTTEFVQQIHQKLNAESRRYEGPLEDVANMVMRVARRTLPKEIMQDLESPSFNETLVSETKALKEISDLLIPSDAYGERKLGLNLFSALLAKRCNAVSLGDKLMERWLNELDEEGLDFWSKEIYSPDLMKKDLKEALEECFDNNGVVEVIHERLVQTGTEMANFMIKEWQPDQVNEFASANPPTYEDGIQAAERYIEIVTASNGRFEPEPEKKTPSFRDLLSVGP